MATLRSFASDDGAWTLFVRRDESDAFVFSVATARGGFFERRLDREALESHIDELGIEIKTEAFTELLLRTLGVRKCVDVVLEDDDDEGSARVLLTYKFSDTISRKGQLALERVSSSVPAAVVELLRNVHATTSEPILTESQKLAKQIAAQVKPKTIKTTSDPLSQESNQSTEGDAAVAPSPVATASVNPQLLKRRHVPTGTVRRKGPRGAKLAKTE